MSKINLNDFDDSIPVDLSNAASILALEDFPNFFQTKDQYDKLWLRSQPTLHSYSTLFLLFRDDELPRLLISSALRFLWQALLIDKEKTISLLAKAARDCDNALSKHWSLQSTLREYTQTREDPSMPVRDKAFLLFNLLTGHIEGVFKKEVWFLLSCNDLVKGELDPSKWQNASLGRVVKGLQSLEPPLGNILGTDPVPGISLNQLRNVGAHEDFRIVRDVISLNIGAKKTKNEFSLRLWELESALDSLGKQRMIAKVFINLAIIQNLDDIIAKGYEALAIPETLAADLSQQLAVDGIKLDSVERENGDTVIKCSSLFPFDGFDAILRIMRYLPGIRVLYNDTFGNKPESLIRIIVSSHDGETQSLAITFAEADIIKNPTHLANINPELQLGKEKKRFKMKYNEKIREWVVLT